MTSHSVTRTLIRPGFSADLTQYEAVGSDDDDEGCQVERCDVEQVVGEFVRRAREEIERDALREPREERMRLDVKDDTLKTANTSLF